jgi:hypothetical protein
MTKLLAALPLLLASSNNFHVQPGHFHALQTPQAVHTHSYLEGTGLSLLTRIFMGRHRPTLAAHRLAICEDADIVP